jgi:hypothetical protein
MAFTMAIILILTLVSTKAIGYLIMMNKAEPVSQEIATVLDRAVTAGKGSGADVYTFMNNTYLQNAVKTSSVMSVTAGAVHHGLGAGANGSILDVVNLSTVAGSGMGNDYGFVLGTLSGVSDAVCYKLASNFGGYADRVIVNGTIIKDTNPTTTTKTWNIGTAQAACDAGNGGANKNIVIVGRRLVSITPPANNTQPDNNLNY